MKLDTAEKILEWATGGINAKPAASREGAEAMFFNDAERLAYCVRVTAIVEREATEEYAWSSPDCHDILKEAEKEQGK